MLQAPDLALLRDFLRISRARGARCTLIGAGARVILLDEKWNVSRARATQDWDFVVQVESWEEYHALRSDLISGEGNQFVVTDTQHRLQHVKGGLLDLVPCGAIEDPPEVVTLPGGNRMSVRHMSSPGLRTESIELEPNLFVQVASIPSWALLKLDAYADRRAGAVTKDIEDFYWLLGCYEDAGNEERVFDELGDLIRDDGLDADDAGALLLGRDLAMTHASETLSAVRALLAEAHDPYSRLVNDIRRAERMGEVEEDEATRARICKRIAAFERGLGTSRE
jgi:predicted nucleotidyltransferase